MRWEDQRESRNVEDRRGRVPGGRGMAIGGTGIIIVLLVSWLTGQNPLHLLSQMGGMEDLDSPTTQSGTSGAPQDQLGKFASVVLADTEDTWNAILPTLGVRYQEPRLVLFSGAVQSACGMSSAAVARSIAPSTNESTLTSPSSMN